MLDGVIHLLVIEDDPGDRRMLQMMLSRTERKLFDIRSADSMRIGLDLLQQEEFDVALVDATLDGNDSREFIRRVNLGNPSVAVVVLTDEQDDRFAVESIRAGAQECIVKDSLDPDLLVRILHFAVIRKKMEDSIRISEERHRLFVENANDAIFIIQHGVILFPNPTAEAMLGYSGDELSRIPFESLVHPDDRTMVCERHNRRLKGENIPSTYSYRVVTPSDEELWVEVNAVLIDWEGYPAVLNFVRDITPQKSLENQLFRAQKMEAIGTLAGGIAHDFNNILSAIIGFTELELKNMEEESGSRFSLEQVLKASKRAKNLVKQILTFSRMGKDEKKSLNLGSVIKEGLKMLRASLPSTIEFRPRIRNNAGSVMADPTQMHQILMNLCSNAAHAMRESGGILDVRLEAVDLTAKDMSLHPKLICPGPYVMLSVSDTGHGIKPSLLDRIFDPYYTSKEPGEGTGLGLAVVQGIVHNHNGEILVRSDPGKKTTFEVYLPRIQEEEVPAVEVTKTIPLGNESVLWVDDEQTLVKMGKQILKRLGYKVHATVSSQKALAAFRKSPDKFDLVITDQTMPGLTGVELIKELREIRPDIPVILVSGYSEVVCEKSARRMGVQEFIMKPFETHQIAETIRKALAHSRSKRMSQSDS